jgi:hypothetical protein
MHPQNIYCAYFHATKGLSFTDKTILTQFNKTESSNLGYVHAKFLRPCITRCIYWCDVSARLFETMEPWRHIIPHLQAHMYDAYEHTQPATIISCCHWSEIFIIIHEVWHIACIKDVCTQLENIMRFEHVLCDGAGTDGSMHECMLSEGKFLLSYTQAIFTETIRVHMYARIYIQTNTLTQIHICTCTPCSNLYTYQDVRA